VAVESFETQAPSTYGMCLIDPTFSAWLTRCRGLKLARCTESGDIGFERMESSGPHSRVTQGGQLVQSDRESYAIHPDHPEFRTRVKLKRGGRSNCVVDCCFQSQYEAARF
jgi:hypothetical protein